MNDDAIDKLLSALAHKGRRRMIDLLMAAPGMSVGALASHFQMSRIAALNHLKVLELAELLLSKKVGRTRYLFFNPIPIQLLHDRWTTQFSAFWTERMVDIKATIENRIAKNKEHKSA
jgi:predicted transcriptional regulator